MSCELEIIRNPDTGYPDVQATLAQMDSWTKEEKFMNAFWRLNNLYKIVDKKKRVITFVMKPEQADLYCDPHPRHVICKARQLGMSTLIQLSFLDRALFNSNENIFIIAQDKAAASAIMQTKIKFAYEQLDPAIKQIRHLIKSNNEEFVLSNNSAITVTVSARSATATAIHSSEMAKSYIMDPAKTREFFTGTLPALIPGGPCYIESTAEGPVGDFYDAYQSAFDTPQDPMAFKRHFYPWWNYEEYENSVSPEAGFDADTKKYFQELEARGIRLTERKKNWYAAQERILKFQMKQEYPSFAEEAFAQTAEGLIWGRQIQIIQNTHMVRPTPYLANYPAYVAFDIGYGDIAACWCVQYVDEEWRVFGYMEIRKSDMSWFLEKFAAKGWRFAIIFLPHDAANGKFSVQGSISLAEEVENWGYKVIVMQKTDNKSRDIFNAGKFMLGCRFNNDDASGVPDGLKRLLGYRYRKNADGGFSKEPMHDDNSNGADAFRYLSVASAIIEGEQYSDDLDSFTDDHQRKAKRNNINSVTGY